MKVTCISLKKRQERKTTEFSFLKIGIKHRYNRKVER